MNDLSGNEVETIVVYMVDRHPLEKMNDISPFRWIHPNNGIVKEIMGYIGHFKPTDLSILVDEGPAGPAWMQLMNGLLEGKIETVITHMAPLTSGQRQQLIGVCAYTGARLVTPGDGGRNSFLALTQV
jgi:hypothetical protein